MLAKIRDSIERSTAIFIAANSAKGSTPPQVKPTARPTTAFDRVHARQRQRAHERLVARVLPHKNAGPS